MASSGWNITQTFRTDRAGRSAVAGACADGESAINESRSRRSAPSVAIRATLVFAEIEQPIAHAARTSAWSDVLPEPVRHPSPLRLRALIRLADHRSERIAARQRGEFDALRKRSTAMPATVDKCITRCSIHWRCVPTIAVRWRRRRLAEPPLRRDRRDRRNDDDVRVG